MAAEHELRGTDNASYREKWTARTPRGVPNFWAIQAKCNDRPTKTVGLSMSFALTGCRRCSQRARAGTSSRGGTAFGAGPAFCAETFLIYVPTPLSVSPGTTIFTSRPLL